MTEHKYGVVKSGDPKTKTGKYIVYCTEDYPFHPMSKKGDFSMYLDERSVEGGFYWNGAVIHQASAPDSIPGKPHYHDYIEYVILYGSNPDDPSDLCGEVELWLGDEKHTVTKSCVIIVPAGLSHCPIIFKRVGRPIFFSSCSPAPVLYQHTNRDPKWSHLKDPPKITEVLD